MRRSIGSDQSFRLGKMFGGRLVSSRMMLFKANFLVSRLAAPLAILFACVAWSAHAQASLSAAPHRPAVSAVNSAADANFEPVDPLLAVSRNTVPLPLVAEHSAGEPLSLTVSRIKRTLTIDMVGAGKLESLRAFARSLLTGPAAGHATIDSSPLVARKIRLQV